MGITDFFARRRERKALKIAQTTDATIERLNVLIEKVRDGGSGTLLTELETFLAVSK
jgi:hypothetical protein